VSASASNKIKVRRVNPEAGLQGAGRHAEGPSSMSIAWHDGNKHAMIPDTRAGCRPACTTRCRRIWSGTGNGSGSTYRTPRIGVASGSTGPLSCVVSVKG
jgi:hypothetical protein